MKSFITLRSLLGRIPKSLFEESQEVDFLDWMMDGLKLLPSTLQYEPKIELFEFTNGKLQLPKYVKQINSVYWQKENPSEDCIKSLEDSCIPTVEEEGQDINPAVCKPMITYQMWLDSPYFKTTFTALKYRGTDKSLFSNNCCNLTSSCTEWFSVTHEKMLYISLDCGHLCVNYDSPVCNEVGDILIHDIGILHEFLVAYAIYKHWENRQFVKEEQAGNFYQAYDQKQALLLRQVKGDHLLRNVNIDLVVQINGGNYLNLTKLPEKMFYAR